jgi:hypothetical protein
MTNAYYTKGNYAPGDEVALLVSLGDGPSFTSQVRGGFYNGGNADVRPDTTALGTNLRSFTQYHAVHEAAASIIPVAGTWQRTLGDQGVACNLVVELKSYASGNGQVAAQSFTVEGHSYTVPAMAGRIQLGNNTSVTGPWAYSYSQVVAGAIDGFLHRLLVALRGKSAAQWINIQFASEVDTDNQWGTVDGSTRSDWPTSDGQAVAAYTYMINWLKNPPAGIIGLPNHLAPVTFSMGWAGAWSGQAAFVRSHPASLPVDYLHWNVYNHGANNSAYDNFMQTMTYRMQCAPEVQAKNVIVAEWGCNAAYDQAGYIVTVPAALNQINALMALDGDGQYVMTNYFNSAGNTWGTLSPLAAGQQALKTAYATSPYTS